MYIFTLLQDDWYTYIYIYIYIDAILRRDVKELQLINIFHSYGKLAHGKL